MVNVPRLHGRTPLQRNLCRTIFHNDSSYGNSVWNVTYNFNGGPFGNNFGSGFLNGIGMGIGAGIVGLFGKAAGGFNNWCSNIGNFGCFGGFSNFGGFTGFPMFNNCGCNRTNT